MAQKSVEHHHPHPTDDSVIIPIRVVPRASRSEIVGVEGDTLKVRIAAPPVDDKANKALVKLLAKALGVSSSQVEIISGHKARRKRVQLRGVGAGAVSDLLRRTEDPASGH